jgi:photosystem II stability/assembly factor-like uncharacterized protein
MKNSILIFALFVIIALNLEAKDFWEKTNGPFESGEIVKCIKATPSGELIAGTSNGVYSSSDNGANWAVMYSDTARFNPNYVNTIAIRDDGRIFAGCKEGFYEWNTNSKSWIKHHFISNFSDFTSICFDKNNDIYTISWTGDGTYISKLDNTTKDLKKIKPVASFGTPNIIKSDKKKNTYVVLNNKYLYKSIDGCITWLQINFEMPENNTLNESSLSFDDNDGIYIQSGTDIYYNNNIDEKWRLIGTYYGTTCFEYFNNRLYVATTNTKLFSTSDFGVTWDELAVPTNKSNINTLLMKDNFIYAGLNSRGVYQYNLNTNTWNQHSKGLGHFNTKHLCNSKDGYIFATMNFSYRGTSSNVNDTELFYTKNNGADWIKVENGNNQIYELKSNSRGDLFIISNSGLRMSTDNGLTWQLIISSVYNYALDGDSVIYIATSQNYKVKILLTRDFGKTFEEIFSETAPLIYVYLDKYRNIYIAHMSYGMPHGQSGTYMGAGLYRSLSNGQWKATNVNMIYPPTSYCYTSNGYQFFGTVENGILRSKDKGANWETIRIGKDSCNVPSLTVTGGDSIFAATEIGVYLSTDFGDNWELISDGIGVKKISSVALGNDGYLFAGSDIVYKTTFPQSIFTSVSDPIESDCSIQYYPSPIEDIINISIDDNNLKLLSDIQIYNANGVLVKSIKNDMNNIKLDLSDLQNGFYLLKYQNRSTTFLKVK